jgi:membrane-bound inhibitor of C-type lysozyme
MNGKTVFFLGAALSAAPFAAAAETFQSYVCADGSQFVAAFYPADSRHAHLQLDGRAVALTKGVALSGARYTGGGITLKISKTGTSIKRSRRPVTACSLQ